MNDQITVPATRSFSWRAGRAHGIAHLYLHGSRRSACGRTELEPAAGYHFTAVTRDVACGECARRFVREFPQWNVEAL